MALEDVSYLYGYTETRPETAKRAKKLDVVASKAILKGLIAFGWTWDEILLSRTPLI